MVTSTEREAVRKLVEAAKESKLAHAVLWTAMRAMFVDDVGRRALDEAGLQIGWLTRLQEAIAEAQRLLAENDRIDTVHYPPGTHLLAIGLTEEQGRKFNGEFEVLLPPEACLREISLDDLEEGDDDN